jgi:hypothetical protein
MFRIELCGGEVVSLKPGYKKIFKVWRPLTTGEDRYRDSYEYFLPPDLYINEFEVNSVFCPITQFHIYRRKNLNPDPDGNKDYVYLPFTNPWTSPDGANLQEDYDNTAYIGDGGIITNTYKNYTYDDLFIRAATENANFPAYLPLVLKVCGFENITAVVNDPKEINMKRAMNYHYEERQSLLGYFKTSDLACPVENITLTNELDDHDHYVWLDENDNLMINTTEFIGKGTITFSIESISVGFVTGIKDFILYIDNDNAAPRFGVGGNSTEEGIVIDCSSPGKCHQGDDDSVKHD